MPPDPEEQNGREVRAMASAWALSFFLGFGIGNYYAEAYAYGVAVALSESLGLGMLVAGLTEEEGTLRSLGTLLALGSWCADWGGALYNAHAMAHSTPASSATSGRRFGSGAGDFGPRWPVTYSFPVVRAKF